MRKLLIEKFNFAGFICNSYCKNDKLVSQRFDIFVYRLSTLHYRAIIFDKLIVFLLTKSYFVNNAFKSLADNKLRMICRFSLINICIDFIKTKLLMKFKVFFCGLGLLHERFELTLFFPKNVVYSAHVITGPDKFSFRFQFSRLKFGNAGSFFENSSSVFRFR